MMRINRPHNIAVRMSDLDVQRLQMASALSGVNQSEFVRTTVRDAVLAKLKELTTNAPPAKGAV